MEENKVRIYGLEELNALEDQIRTFVREEGIKDHYMDRAWGLVDFYKYEDFKDLKKHYNYYYRLSSPWLIVQTYPPSDQLIVCRGWYDMENTGRNEPKSQFLYHEWYWDGSPGGNTREIWEGEWIKEVKYDNEGEYVSPKKPILARAEIPEDWLSWFEKTSGFGDAVLK